MAAIPLQGEILTAGAGATVNLDAFALPAFDLTGKMLKLSMWIDDPSNIGTLNFFVGTNNLVNNIKWRFDAETASSRLAKPGEPFTVVLQLAEINTVAGSITLSPLGVPSVTSGFTAARLQASDDATGPIRVRLFSVQIVDGTPGSFVSLTFDDSNETDLLRAFPKMEEYGFKGTAYEIVEHLGADIRMTLAGVKALHAAGWEIGGHHFTAAAGANGYTALTGQQADDDLIALHDWLATTFPGDDEFTFAYAQGKYENSTDGVAIEALVQANGFISGRTILSSTGVSTHTQIAAIPPAMPHRLYAMSAISRLASPTSQYHPDVLTAATGSMLDKVAENGGWLILVFHKITPGDATNTAEISQADFDLIVDAIAARELTVLPVRDVLRLAGTAPSLVPTVSYASSVDLETLLGAQFTAEDHQRADLLLELAGGKIDTRLQQSLVLVADEQVTLDGTGTRRLLLPAWPVTAVASVVEDGKTLVFDDDYRWSASGILTRVGGCWPREPRSVQVTFTHGYAVIPAGVRGAVVQIAGVWFENPLQMQSETFVDYSYRVASTQDSRVEDILDELEGVFGR